MIEAGSLRHGEVTYMQRGYMRILFLIAFVSLLVVLSADAACPLRDLDCMDNLRDVQILYAQWPDEDWSCDCCTDFDENRRIGGDDFTLLGLDWPVGELPLVINEFMASNSSSHRDPQGQYDDWIEIYNDGDYQIDLGGMYLTDDFNEPKLWRIPDSYPAQTTIAPHGYLVIWADKDTSDGPLHADFELRAEGEQIGLIDAVGNLIDSIVFGAQTANTSLGRYPDSTNNWRSFSTPTPEAENDSAYLGMVADTKFNPDRGFFVEPLYIEITSATEGATVVYTLNGSEPSATYGEIYDSPIRIETTTIVRAMAFKPGWLQTNVDTHSYIFLEDVIHQPADIPGYPHPWTWLGGSKYAYHDYEMDPEVVSDPAYNGMIIDSLMAIPTLSIATNRENLDTFYWGSGESVASMELIYPGESQKNVQAECGVQPHSHNRMKRSLRLNFRASYGDAQLESDIFRDAPLNGDTAADTFNKIILRGGNNRSWARIWNPERTTYTMDQWYRDTQISMSGIGSHGTFVHLYINGLYWGLYNAVERPDASFVASYMGGQDEDWYSVSHGGSHGGDASRWNYLKNTLVNKNIADQANYTEIQQYLDIEKYIDYVILTWFVGMTDWPGNNWWGANRNDVPGPFTYFGWDAEWSWLTTRGHNNGWVHPDFRSSKSGGRTIAAIWHCLRYNNDFMMLFEDRVYKHLFNDGVLTDQNCIARYLTLNDFIRDAVVAESARWGDTCEGVGHPTRTRDIDWIFAENEMLGPSFMADNAARFISALKSEGYYPDIAPPSFSPHGGQVTDDFELEITNPNSSGAIYYTLDGSDPRILATQQQTGITLIAESGTKKVLTPLGFIRDYWRGGRPFDDSAWAVCTGHPGGVGFETNSGYEELIGFDVEQQMYEQQSTCYIRIPFTISDDLSRFDLLTLKVRYDDGFIAYINGTEVQRANFTGLPSWNSSADSGHSDSEAISFESFDISDYIDVLRHGENILAIHGLNSSSESSDFLISIEMVIQKSSSAGEAVSPAVIEYTQPIRLTESCHVKTRTLSDSVWSPLNEAIFSAGPIADSLRITEIMYHPQDTGSPDDPNTEFLELKNTGADALNLNLVSFSEGVRFTFPGIELLAGEYVLLVKNISAFEAKYGPGRNVAGEYSGSLNNGGERIVLRDAAGRTIHDFSYKDDWYPNTDGMGFSLTVKDPANTQTDNWGDKSIWRPSVSIGGSPGYNNP